MQPVYYNIPKTNIVFVGMPKCGNSSILDSFRVFLDGEESKPKLPQTAFLNYSLSKKDVYNRRSEFFIFSISRNPYDRLVSHYFDKVNGTKLHPRLERFGFTHKMNFQDYCQVLKNKFLQINDLHLRPQFEISFHRRCFLPNYVIKFERLNSDFKFIASYVKEMYSKDITLPHLNPSRRSPVSHVVTDTEAKDIIEIYKRDFNFFGYDTNSFNA